MIHLKIEWLDRSIKYYFENKESIFKKDFFCFVGDGIIGLKYKIKMHKDHAEVYFNNESINVVMINGRTFIKPIAQEYKGEPEVARTELELELESIIESTIEEKSNFVQITEVDGALVAFNPSSEEIEFNATVKEYMKETYPDFAQKTKEIIEVLKPFGKKVICNSIKSRIVTADIDGIEYKLDFVPSYYFTTVVALKEYIKTTGLVISEKTDEQLKEKIMEKSTLLKRKFGLLSEHLENFELYPAYKQVVHLYCLYDLVVYDYLENFTGGGDTGATTVSGGRLTLGKFTAEDGSSSTGGGGSSSSSYLPDIIKIKISDAEQNLRDSLINKCISFKNKTSSSLLTSNFRIGGCNAVRRGI